MTPTAAKQTVPTPPADGALLPELDPALIPNLDDLVTEDGAPVDNIYTEKQCRLLTEPLYSSWTGPGEGRSFLALANVGWFHTSGQPPLVPDTLLSLDVAPAGALHTKEGRSYFQWLIGKAPDVVVEIVSDRRGGEEDFKMQTYARLRALFYVIYDPGNLLQGGVLRAYGLQRSRYEPVEPRWFPEVGLGLTLWEGTFEGQHETWLRWCDQEGHVIPTGAERAEEERRRADAAAERFERLAAQLRALGIEPEV
jgi:Uma2 family endonuclease